MITCRTALAQLAVAAVGSTVAFAGTGDVNNDGRIGLGDAVQAARFCADPLAGTSGERARADVLPLTSDAGDGLVTVSDVRHILRTASGLEEHPAWIPIPVFAYRVCDDNGGRCAAITPDEVQAWVDYANLAYAPAHVRFSFRSSDMVTINSTLLNGMAGVGDALWTQERDEANRLATDRSGFVTVFFRYGPGPSPTGGGFSWWDYSFAVMPGFHNTGVCGHQNQGLFAHELGHYFGLSHTFAREFATVSEAAEYLNQNNGNTAVFNGDDFSDTPPDPFIQAIQCDTSESVVLSGQSMPIARHNLMSYWEAPDRTLSAQQSQRVRWMARTRGRNGMRMPTNSGVVSALEANALTVTGASGISYGWQDMSPWGATQWNNGDHLFCGANRDGWIDLRLSVGSAGTSLLSAYLTQAPDFGIVRVFLDGKPIGDTFDAYAFQVMPSGRVDLGFHDLPAGNHTIRFQSISKNPLSSNYYFGVDCLTLQTRSS